MDVDWMASRHHWCIMHYAFLRLLAWSQPEMGVFRSMGVMLADALPGHSGTQRRVHCHNHCCFIVIIIKGVHLFLCLCSPTIIHGGGTMLSSRPSGCPCTVCYLSTPLSPDVISLCLMEGISVKLVKRATNIHRWKGLHGQRLKVEVTTSQINL